MTNIRKHFTDDSRSILIPDFSLLTLESLTQLTMTCVTLTMILNLFADLDDMNLIDLFPVDSDPDDLIFADHDLTDPVLINLTILYEAHLSYD